MEKERFEEVIKALQDGASLDGYSVDELVYAGFKLLNNAEPKVYKSPQPKKEIIKEKTFTYLATKAFEIAYKLEPENHKSLYGLGIAYRDLASLLRREGNIEKAEEKLNKAIELLRKACEVTRFEDHNLGALRVVYGSLSDILKSKGKTEEAIARLNEAIEFFKEACEVRGFAGYKLLLQIRVCYFRLWEILKSEGKIREARINLNEAVKFFRKACEITEYKSPPCLQNLGWLHFDSVLLGLHKDKAEAEFNLNKAIEFLKKACEATNFKNSHDLHHLGTIYLRSSEILIPENLKDAKVKLNEAIRILRKACEVAEFKKSLSNLCHAYFKLSEVLINEGKTEEAIARLNEAIEFLKFAYEITGFKDSPSLHELKQAYFKLSEILINEGKTEEAIARLNEAIEFFKNACKITGFEDSSSIYSLKEACEKLSEIFVTDSDAARRRGELAEKRGDADIAKEYFERARESIENAKIKLNVAIESLRNACKITGFEDSSNLNNLGEVYEELSEILVTDSDVERAIGKLAEKRGDADIAREHFERARESMKNAKNSLNEAIKFLKRACDITEFKDSSNLNRLGVVYFKLSEILRLEGNLRYAKINLKEAIKVFRKSCEVTGFTDSSSLHGLGISYKKLAEISLSTGYLEEAQGYITKAVKYLELACEITNYRKSTIVSNLAATYIFSFYIPGAPVLNPEKVKRLIEIYMNFFYQKSLTLEYNLLSTEESYLVRVAENILTLSFFSIRRGFSITYESLKAITASKSPFMKAFRLIKSLSKEIPVSEEVPKVDNRLISSRVKNGRETDSPLFVLKSVATHIERRKSPTAKLQLLEKFLERANIKTTWDSQNYIELIKESLKDDEILLFAYPAWQAGKSFFLILWKKGKEINAKLIDSSIKKNRKFFYEGFDETDPDVSFDSFYEKQRIFNNLFGNLTKELFSDKFSHINHIYFLPFGLLNLVSFQALTHNVFPFPSLIERFTISYLPDLELLERREDRTTSREVVVFACESEGTAPILYSEAEKVKEVLGKHGRKTHYKEDPTRNCVKQNLKDKEFEVVYFSTHGKGGFDKPIDSCLLLKDGKFTVVDLANLDFKADVAVISACEVDLTLSKGVDDASELERAFIVAGAKNVVAPIPAVNALHTKEFLPLFIDKFLQKKDEGILRPAAKAFREACLEMKRKGLHIWSQFRLTGTG